MIIFTVYLSESDDYPFVIQIYIGYYPETINIVQLKHPDLLNVESEAFILKI